jgi:hypothetical protein
VTKTFSGSQCTILPVTAQRCKDAQQFKLPSVFLKELDETENNVKR